MKLKIIIPALFSLIIFSCNSPSEKNNSDDVIDKTTTPDLSIYMQEGGEITASVQAELGMNLKKAMEEGGLEKAIPFCNTIAIPIVDSFSTLYNAQIKRTSQKVRNTADKPNDIEVDVLEEFQSLVDAGEVIHPKAVMKENVVNYYSPIIIQPLCLKCHGDINSDIGADNYSLITRYYEEDEAVGYKLGDLRGMWSISFQQKD